MKTAVIVACLLIGRIANAQITGFRLDEDPIFAATIAQYIHYPVEAIRGSIYGRFYANFTIDSTGCIQNVSVLYPKISPKYSKRLGFESEIIGGLKHLPQLSSRYKGSYILPIAFVYVNYSEDSKHLIPNNVLPEKYAENGIHLNEVRIVGRSNAYNSLRPVSRIAPPSRQIVLY